MAQKSLHDCPDSSIFTPGHSPRLPSEEHDPEGYLLEAVRGVVGDSVPIVIVNKKILIPEKSFMTIEEGLSIIKKLLNE